MLLLEAKSKFFDLQRAVEKQQAVLNNLVNERVKIVKLIEDIEAGKYDDCSPETEKNECSSCEALTSKDCLNCLNS